MAQEPDAHDGPPRSREPRISVALVTRNRAESLERTLASLLAQEGQPFEVVVSDDSDDEQAAVVRATTERHGCRYERGPRRGLYANRNAVALACRGTHIRTMDDDHEFPPGHWQACEEAVGREPDSIWVIGETYPGDRSDAALTARPVQLHPRGYGITPATGARSSALSDGATIFPRRVFDSGCRYAESFVFGAAYLEFGDRLSWLGYTIRELDTTHVLHHYDPAARSVMNEEVDLGSRVFAMLCHSFRYQRTLPNMGQTLGQLGLEFIRKPGIAGRAIRAGFSAFRQRVSN